MNKYAFVIMHFGSNTKYLEYELYTILMLKKYSTADIVYMYSVTDTPDKFIKIINSMEMNVKIIPYDDTNITYNVDFKSNYSNFNTLRTCNFIFALKLIEYKRICIIESDMIILSNVDEIFHLKQPSVLYNSSNDLLGQVNNSSNDKLLLERNPIKTLINGGVLLVKPSMRTYKRCIKKMSDIIKSNYEYPNEILIMKVFRKKLHNLPIQYNYSKYSKNEYSDIKICHFHGTQFKPLDIIKDKYDSKFKRKNLIKYLEKFKSEFFDIYHTWIQILLTN